ncbi:hypothetical protein FKG95_06235 [Denitrobaculum tricleocarpae]|uniref:Uncharacterized protein n=1 Tax=Denitrobaculum tricleocarpae TaxID=2591009 RepID=A0A545TXC5_9PROT|nr:hypothetical protein FKG95_06235 [Denitrobaculum tricleocarpae]
MHRRISTDQVIFPPAVLDDPNLIFLARGSGSAIDAGCVANLSNDATGLSNVFSAAQDHQVFAQATQAASALRPGSPVVGYESSSRLAAAESTGFRNVGDLRVLVRPS